MVFAIILYFALMLKEMEREQMQKAYMDGGLGRYGARIIELRVQGGRR